MPTELFPFFSFCRLKKLSLSNTQVTDAGLPSLRAMLDLQELCLDRTAVTSRGVAQLIKHLPQLQVNLKKYFKVFYHELIGEGWGGGGARHSRDIMFSK